MQSALVLSRYGRIVPMRAASVATLTQIIFKNINYMKRLLLLILILLAALPDTKAAVSLYVGETATLTCSAKAPAGYIDHVFFNCVNQDDYNYLGIGYNSADGKATLYGLCAKADIKVEVAYSYTYTGVDNRRHVGTGSYIETVTVKHKMTVGQVYKSQTEEGIGMYFVLTKESNSSNSYYVATVPNIQTGCCLDVKAYDFEGKITIPSKVQGFPVKMIGGSSFDSVYGLTEIVIPASVQEIGDYTFLLCSPDKIVCLGSTPPKCTKKAFDLHSATVYVPKGAISRYKAAAGWSDFYDFKEIGSEGSVAVNSISLDTKDASLAISDTKQLTATISPTDATDKSLSWASSNTDVATVTTNGYVVAKGEGTTTISCASNDGSGIQAKCTVSVYKVKVETVEISSTEETLRPNATLQLTSSVAPANATNKAVTWNSSNSNVATVSSSGLVTAKDEGSAVITCTANDGSGTKAQCSVVVSKIHATDISLSSSLTLTEGESKSLSYTITPSNAEDAITWKSDNPAIASVTSSGLVNAIAAGTTNVRVATSNGLSAACKVTVKELKPSSISLSATSLSFREGDSQQLTATVVPSNSHYTLTWSSSNTAVATVSQTGLVKAVGGGTAQITVTTDNGLKATCSVTSVAEPKAISVPSAISLYPDSQRQLKYTLDPIGARDEVVWRGSNPTVVTVTEKGLLTAVGPGQARVTAITHNGLQATCRVVVPEPDFNLHVFHHSGEQVDFPLRERPSISVEDGTLRITTASTVIEYAEESIEHFTIDDMRTNELPSAITIPAELRMNYREHATLSYTLYPEDYDIESTVKWETSDRYVAQVDQQGHVYANLPGECTITATTHNGHTSECRVTVADHDFYLVLWHKTGEKTGYKLKTHPQVTYTDPSGGFGDGEVLTVLSSEVRIDYPAGSIQRFTLNSNPDGIPDGIRAIEADGPAPGTIDLSHAHPGSTISIYDTAGHCLATYTANGEGRVSYSLDAYPQGIYIIKTETTTFKITKQ